MKSNIKRLIILSMAAIFGMIEVANAFYDPGLQRWINRDPIQENGGLNLYAHVWNNPVSEIDPLGKCPALLWPAAVAFGEALPAILAGLAITGETLIGASMVDWGGGSVADAGPAVGVGYGNGSGNAPPITITMPLPIAPPITMANRGDRVKTGEGEEQLRDIERAQDETKKRRPSIQDEDDEWDGAPNRPKADTIREIGRSRQRARSEDYECGE